LLGDVQQLFRQHSSDIARALQRYGFSRETAADLTQDAFVRVLAMRPDGRSTCHNPRAYLYTIARNLGISQKRRERVVPMLPLTDDVSEQLQDQSPSAERRLCSQQQLARVESALAELPDRTRYAYEMHRVEGRKLADISAELSISIPRTWMLIKGAYRHLLLRVEPA